MAYIKGNNEFFYIPDGHVEKEYLGKTYYRNDSFPKEVWKILPHPIDRLLSHIRIMVKPNTQLDMLNALHIDSATVSRVRHGVKIPLEWLVKMSDYTGLTLTELRAISGLKPVIMRFDEEEE